MTARWRVVYFGTPEVAVAPLQALCRAGHDVALVVTRPPKRRGRRQEPTPHRWRTRLPTLDWP